MLDLNLIGSRIKELRIKKGLTQSEFAKVLSVSFQAVIHRTFLRSFTFLLRLREEREFFPFPITRPM